MKKPMEECGGSLGIKDRKKGYNMLYLDDEIVYVTMFPDKTSQVWKLPKGGTCITWEFEHEGEFMHLAQLVQILRSSHTDLLTLYMPYLPYGRQDKPVDNVQTFALYTFANLLNTLNFNKITSLDAHSEKAEFLIRNFYSISPEKEIDYALQKSEADMLCYPDSGAALRYGEEFSGWPSAEGNKRRDPITGRITEYELVGEVKNNAILIVDDICDGGATFVSLSRRLIELGAAEVNLYITHGIFSRGLEVLKEAGINLIFTREGEVRG